MTANLVRTTTYFEPQLLNWAKKKAIDEGMDLYEILNDAVRRMLVEWGTVKAGPPKKIKYEDFFGPPLNLKLKKQKLTRADYYE